MGVLAGEKILVTGAAGQIGLPLVGYLAQDNEVWGVARFRAEGSEARVRGTGARTARVDLSAGDFADLPTDFTYVIHLAAYIGPNPDINRAMSNNAESSGYLMSHYRQAKAILVMSTHSVYRPNPDPDYRYSENDPLGETNAAFAPTYAMSKIGQEAVARTCCRLFNVPTVIARMNASYGPNGGLPAYDADSVVAGRQVLTRHDPSWYSPIYEDDINSQAGLLLQSATVPATIVNWAGDEAVSVQQWCALAAETAGCSPPDVGIVNDGGPLGAVADVSKRLAITGPCAVRWREGIAATVRARHGTAGSS